MNQHTDLDPKRTYRDEVDDSDDDAYLDEPFPSSMGQPIEPIHIDAGNTATQHIPQHLDDTEYSDQQCFDHPSDHAQNVAPNAVPQHAFDQAYGAQPNPDHEFKPTPILVPVPDPIGRSKIRKEKQRRKRKIAIGILGVIAIAALIVIFFPWDRTITMNGREITVKAHTTLHEAAEGNGVYAKPGNFLAIDGSVIEEGKGAPYTFTVNGNIETDPDYEVKQNDVIEVGDGNDITEEFTEETITTSAPVAFEGVGAVHKFENNGEEGSVLRKVGLTSGIVLDSVQTEPTTQTMKKYNINSNGDKVIALTFDDGPWKQYTSEILDILAANNAKATFFTVGNRIGSLEDVVKRASDEGHQVCTHSWDHASGSGQGVNLDYMTDEEQRQEISKGMEAISQATGKDASKVVRVPGGNLSENTARILSEFSTSEIGWNIDTHDWKRPGAEAIYNALLLASPGDIILMHDGGGDRSQTVQALRDALPVLIQEGYRFITIDELIENYPENGQESS